MTCSKQEVQEAMNRAIEDLRSRVEGVTEDQGFLIARLDESDLGTAIAALNINLSKYQMAQVAGSLLDQILDPECDDVGEVIEGLTVVRGVIQGQVEKVKAIQLKFADKIFA